MMSTNPDREIGLSTVSPFWRSGSDIHRTGAAKLNEPKESSSPEVKHNNLLTVLPLAKQHTACRGDSARQWILLHPPSKVQRLNETLSVILQPRTVYNPVHFAIDRFARRAFFFRDL